MEHAARLTAKPKKGLLPANNYGPGWKRELENTFAKDPAKRLGGWVVRFKGMEVNFTLGSQPGKRVNYIKVGGKPVDLNREYSFVACEREGDPDTTLCRMQGVQQPKLLGHTMHKVIEEYPGCTFTHCACSGRALYRH